MPPGLSVPSLGSGPVSNLGPLTSTKPTAPITVRVAAARNGPADAVGPDQTDAAAQPKSAFAIPPIAKDNQIAAAPS